MWNIIAVILAVALAALGIGQVFGSYKTGEGKMSQQMLESQLATTISAVTNAFKNNHNYTGFNNDAAKRVGATAANWTGGGDDTTPYTLPSGGTVLFNAATVNGAANRGYSMTFGNMQADMCQTVGSIDVPQLVSIKIGSTTYGNPAYGGTSTVGWPVPPSEIAAKCGALTATDTVILTLT